LLHALKADAHGMLNLMFITQLANGKKKI